MRIHRLVSKKKYLHGKRAYEYERFYVLVPKRFQQIVKFFAGQDVKVKVEKDRDGFVLKVRITPRLSLRKRDCAGTRDISKTYLQVSLNH